MIAQPLVSVRDVQISSRWYQAALNLTSGHGGPEYEQLMFDGAMVMQLHHWAPDEHPQLGSPTAAPAGNGVALWFMTQHFDEAMKQIKKANATIVEGPQHNPNANHREVWLRDPDGYIVVVAGVYGDV